MRIVWKDSSRAEQYKPIKYRNHILRGTANEWTTDLPGDDNLYKNHYSAQNAVDAFYGELGLHGTEKRKGYGIQITGKKDGETA
jgi:hypothetical protein